MDNGLFDNSTGDVVIRDGSVETQGTHDAGFFTTGGGGGLSGGFGGSSRKRAKKRAKARAEALARQRAEQQAAADAAHQAQLAAAHRQWVEHFSRTQQATRTTIDQHYTAHLGNVGQALEAELQAVRKYVPSDGSERWQLYLITRERRVVEELIAAKTAELQRKTQLARGFDGQDPLQRSAQDYATHLAQQSSS